MKNITKQNLQTISNLTGREMDQHSSTIKSKLHVLEVI